MGKKNKDRIIVDTDLLPRYEREDKVSVRECKRLYQEQYQREYRKKTKVIRVTLSEEEYEKIKQVASSEGKTMSGLLLRSYKNWQGKQFSINKMCRDVLKELGRIGTNINQMARTINSRRLARFWMKKELDKAGEELRKLRESVFHAED